jgi:hypothetical protein
VQIEFGGPDQWPTPIDKKICVPKKCKICITFVSDASVLIFHLYRELLHTNANCVVTLFIWFILHGVIIEAAVGGVTIFCR